MKALQLCLLFIDHFHLPNLNLDLISLTNFGAQICLSSTDYTCQQKDPKTLIHFLACDQYFQGWWNPSRYVEHFPTNFCFAKQGQLYHWPFVEYCLYAQSFALNGDRCWQKQVCKSLETLILDFDRAVASIHFTIDRGFWACRFLFSTALSLAPLFPSFRSFSLELHNFPPHKIGGVLKFWAHYFQFSPQQTDYLC